MARPRSQHVPIRRPRTVFLYEDPATPVLDEALIAADIRAMLGVTVRVRGEFMSTHSHGRSEALAPGLAAARVRHPDRPPEAPAPLYGEVQFELRMLEDPARKAAGVLYDAHRLDAIYRGLLRETERSLRVAHVIFTSRLFGTFEEDGRYHARVNLCGFPSVVSTSGIVEGPARPREYYSVKARVAMALGSVPFEAVKEPFRGQFIDYDDPRLTEVLKGYVLQCLFYQIAGEAFCDDPRCRLFNAHWQSEVIVSQLESGDLCRRHADLAASIRSLARSPKAARKG